VFVSAALFTLSSFKTVLDHSFKASSKPG